MSRSRAPLRSAYLLLLLTVPFRCFGQSDLSVLTYHITDQGVPYGASISYASAILHSSREFKINPYWWASVLTVERHFKPSGTDGRGSFGIPQMQVETTKAVARELGDDPNEVTEAWIEAHPITMIRYGARHFADLLEQFRGPNRYYWATRAYNAGSKRIFRARRGSPKYRRLSEKYYQDTDLEYRKLLKAPRGL